MKNETRIKLGDSYQDIILKIVEGNPGAISVITEIVKNAPRIDPDNLLKGVAPILTLDTLNIYGSRIWILYKDVCGQDIVKMIACLRAYQLGIISLAQIYLMIDTYGQGEDKKELERIVKEVQKKLPNFAKNEKLENTEDK